MIEKVADSSDGIENLYYDFIAVCANFLVLFLINFWIPLALNILMGKYGENQNSLGLTQTSSLRASERSKTCSPQLYETMEQQQNYLRKRIMSEQRVLNPLVFFSSISNKFAEKEFNIINKPQHNVKLPYSPSSYTWATKKDVTDPANKKKE